MLGVRPKAVRRRLSFDIAGFEALDWSFPDSDRTRGLHSVHPYPACFIPEIPRTLLNLFSFESASILDPFCGSGPTLTEAQEAGCTATGIDLNPIACLISSVKTTGLSPRFTIKAETTVRAARRQSSPAEIPHIPKLDHWFDRGVQANIARLARELSQMRAGPDTNALRLALSAIIVKVSRQDSDTRYAAVRKKTVPEDVFRLFSESAQRIHRFVPSIRCDLPKVNVVNGDVVTELTQLPDDLIDIVITSPPYPNAYEYWLYHKYRMYWLGYDPVATRELEIGARAHYFRKNPATAEQFAATLNRIMLSLARVVRRGGYICFVIGRSRIRGIEVDNAQFVRQAAAAAGFELVATSERAIDRSRKRFNLSHARIVREAVLIHQLA